MKNIVLIIITFFLFLPFSYATDSCEKIILQEAEFIWEITFWSNVRSYPCVNKSKILRWAKTWEQYKVIAKVDWWYKVKMDNWDIAWIWDKAIKKVWELDEQDKWQEIIVKIKEPYKLTTSDYAYVNKITARIKKLVNKKWYKYKDLLVNALQKYLIKKNRSEKIIAVINEVIKNTKKVSLKDNSLTHYKKFNINIDKVKEYWLNLHNIERKKLWLPSFSYDDRLDNTAYERSMESLDKWVLDHRREAWETNYDYKKIENWFQERWVKCKVKNRTTSSESIWKFAYLCDDSDCSDDLYKTTKTIFDIYMAEKWTSYDLHYRAIAHSNITKIWLWFGIKGPDHEWFYDYYITTHYCTEFE